MKDRRNNFFESINHQQPEQIPYFFVMCKELENKFKNKYGNINYREYFELPFREIFLRPTRRNNNQVYEKYINNLSEEYIINEWGIGIKKGSEGHFFTMKGPLEQVNTIKELEKLPFPDFLEKYRWDGVKETIDKYKKQDYITMSGIFGDTDVGEEGEPRKVPAFISTFENCWYIRGGLDKMLIDFYSNPDFAAALLDRMTEFNMELATRWASVGIDIIVFGDDVGGQESLIMSPQIYRKWLKPRLKKIIKAAKDVNPDVLIYYHSDGYIEPIIPDLIEAGVEILNPVQPECMDPIKINEKYGEKLSFWGTLGTQTTMPFGTTEEVEKVCRERISRVGKNGGLILAPTHLLEPEVPLENIEAFVSVVQNV